MKRTEKLPRGVFVRDGAYWIRYRDQNGRLHREKAGPFLETAKAYLSKRHSEKREGKFFPEKIRARAILFGDIARDYLKLAKVRKRSWRDDEDHLQALKSLDGLPIAELTPTRLEGVLGELAEEREWRPATFNRHRSTVSGVLRSAIRSGKAQTNPAREIKKRAEENTRVRYLTAEEEEKLVGVLRGTAPEREAEILVAIHSGMRRSEQYKTHEVPDGGLKWEHIDLKAGLIRLPRSKSGKARHIPINSVLRRTLAALPRVISSPYVFETTDPNKWFRGACETAEISDFTWHDLRHTFASRLAQAGIPIKTIADLMGHSEITTTMRYAHLQPQLLADAVESLVENPVQSSTTSSTRSSAVSGDPRK